MEQTDIEVPRKPWGKWIAIFLGAIFVLLILAYFVGTSSAFVKGVILPRVGNAVNAKITVADLSVSPFSQVYLRQLRVESSGSEPLLTAEEARVRYSLLDIIKGNIKVDELTLNSPVVNIVQEPDGSSNLDPLTKGGNKSSSSKPSDKSPQISIANISLKNGTVRQTQKAKDGSVTQTELQGLAIDLDHLGNGQTGHLKIASSFDMNQRQGATNNVLAGQISGGYDIALDPQLMPGTVKGAVTLTVTRADGSFKELAGFNGSLDADLTPKEIRQIALRFARNDQQLGLVRVSGPLDIDKKEGTLKLEINSIDKNVLALATAGKGYDFGNSRINATNQITISQAGTFISASGNVAATSITLVQNAVKSPEMNFNLDYQVGVNTSDKSAVLQKVNFTGSANGKDFLRTDLDRQMTLSWGQSARSYPDAALSLVVTNLNIADWRAMAGTNINAGLVNARITLSSQQNGRMLATDVAASIAGLSAQFGSNHLENAGLTLEGTGTVEQLKIINLTRYALALRQNDGAVLQATGSARYSLDTKDTTAQLTAEGALPRLLALAAIPQASAAGGTLKASANYTDNGTKRSAVGNVAVADFTGGFQKYSFTNFSVTLDYNVDVDQHDLTLNRTALSFGQGVSRGGTLELKGKYTLESKAGQFNFTTVDMNQNVFGPILAPSLGDNQLVSISLNASGDAKIDPKGENSVNASVKLNNWVVQDKAGKMPKTALSVDMKIDGGMQKQIVELRQFLVQLTETPRAKNALRLQARLDLSPTNATPSTLSVTSESFDVTPYYDLFAGQGTNNKSAATSPEHPAPGAPSEQKEPDAMQLPFQQLTADLKIDRLYLREIAISNWLAKVTIRSNVVQLNPFSMQLNGAPLSVTGNINVGWPGYLYDLALKADSVPLAPLANSFDSSGKTNTIQGSFLADAQIRGAGVTGPSLRKNLAGTVNLNLTNLNYQAVGPKLRRILVPISVFLRAPELTDSPINWVAAQTTITNGIANLKHLGIESEAFYAESAGSVTLADVLTNSTLNLPVDLSLRRSLVQKSGLLPTDNSTNKYAKLPQFVSIKGTVGLPETEINKLAVAGTLLRGAAALNLGGGTTQNALGAVGNLLTGQSGGTNATGTNTSANLSRTLGSLLGGKTATNAATPVTATTPVVTNAVQNALDSLFRPKPKKK